MIIKVIGLDELIESIESFIGLMKMLFRFLLLLQWDIILRSSIIKKPSNFHQMVFKIMPCLVLK